MPGVILTVLDQAESVAAVLSSAAHLAGLSGGATIQALVIRTPPEATILPSEEVLTRQHEDRIRAAEQARVATLREACAAWTGQTGHPVALLDAETLPAEAVAEHGAAADFLVIRQPRHDDPAAAGQIVHAALFQTSRPVLLLPPGAFRPFGRCVAIAWRDDGRAVKAVLPILQLLPADTRFHVLQGAHGDAPPLQVPSVLQEHGVAAELHRLQIETSFGAHLLEKAHALGADLLVMGAYAHSLLREMILGGVTRFMLEHADLPILLRH